MAEVWGAGRVLWDPELHALIFARWVKWLRRAEQVDGCRKAGPSAAVDASREKQRVFHGGQSGPMTTPAGQSASWGLSDHLPRHNLDHLSSRTSIPASCPGARRQHTNRILHVPEDSRESSTSSLGSGRPSRVPAPRPQRFSTTVGSTRLLKIFLATLGAYGFKSYGR